MPIATSVGLVSSGNGGFGDLGFGGERESLRAQDGVGEPGRMRELMR
jgi:hypothetical protein